MAIINNMSTLSNSGVAANATPADVLETFSFIGANNIKEFGTIKNNGSIQKTLKFGESYTIPEGYHTGFGYVQMESLEDATKGTATPDKIAAGKTAWVNGVKVSGTIPVYHANEKGIDVSNNDMVYENDKLKIFFPYGIYRADKEGHLPFLKLDGETLLSKLGIDMGLIARDVSILGKNGTYTSDATATADKILKDRTAYVNGVKITGTLEIQSLY